MFQDLAQAWIPRAPAQGVAMQPNGKRRATAPTTTAAEVGAYGHPSASAVHESLGPTTPPDPPGIIVQEVVPGPQFSVTEPGPHSGS